MSQPRDPEATRANGADRHLARDGVDERLDESLSALAIPPVEPPAMSEELTRALADLAPVRTRTPRLEGAAVLSLSLIYAAGILSWMGVRPDLAVIPRLWLVLVGGLWLVSYVSITWLVLVPPREQVIPRWRWAAALAGMVATLFIAGGLLRPESVAAIAADESSLATVVDRGHGCLRSGLAIAMVPIILTAVAMRAALPVGSRWVAAAIGAAGGSLGGLTLHLHCPIGGRLHIGLVHGGLVVVAALLTALAARVAEAARSSSDRRARPPT